MFIRNEELDVQFYLFFIHLIFSRVWKAAGVCTHILEGHRGAITSVRIVNPEGASRTITCSLWTVVSYLKFMITNPFFKRRKYRKFIYVGFTVNWHAFIWL